MHSRIKAGLRAFAAIAFSAYLMFIFFTRVNVDEVATEFKKINLITFGVSVVIVWLMILINSCRYRGILRNLGLDARVLDVFRINLATIFLAHLTPVNLIADGIRAGMLWRKLKISISDGLQSVARERISMLFYCTVCVLLMLPVQYVYDLSALQITSQAVLACSLVLALYLAKKFLVMFAPKEGKISKLIFWSHNTLEYCSFDSRNAWNALLVMIQLLIYATMFWLISREMGIPIPFGLWVAITPVTYLLQNLPITYMGWGVREFVLIGGLHSTGFASDASVGAVSVAAGLIFLLASLPGVFFVLAEIRQRPS